MADKRKSPPLSNGAALVKRQRQEENGANTMQLAIGSTGDGKSKGLIKSIKRTSSLSTPIVSLSGAHNVSVISVLRTAS